MSYENLDSPLDAMAHFGVKGMQWGVRRGKKKSGVGRIRGAASQALFDEARRRRSAASSVGKNLAYNTSHARIRRRSGNLNTAKNQEASARRILAGRTTTKDFLRAYGNISVSDLLVTTTPRTQNNR
jgi:hypothetical protein